MTEKEAPVESEKGGWWSRLKQGLKRSSDRLGDGLKTIFVSKKLDQATLDELEELLITSDLGPETASRLTTDLGKQRLDQEITIEEVKAYLATAIEGILDPIAKPLTLDAAHKPHVVLVVGVNGSGKTTTMGKFAKQWKDQGLSVMMAAGDTFRAAAVEQLQIWGQRLNVPVISGAPGADAAGLAFDALTKAKEVEADVLLIDTAGRLQNKAHLMEELKKIQRVLSKVDPSAPHSTLLILVRFTIFKRLLASPALSSPSWMAQPVAVSSCPLPKNLAYPFMRSGLVRQPMTFAPLRVAILPVTWWG
jgi:fused signal recognition particle receptor